MTALTEHTDLIDLVLFERPDKGLQYRLSITEFRGSNYFSIREWYADYEGNFAASTNGVTIPYELAVCSSLLSSLLALLSKAEVTAQVIQELDSLKLTQLQDLAVIHKLSKDTALSINQLKRLELIGVENYEDNSLKLTIKVPKDVQY